MKEWPQANRSIGSKLATDPIWQRANNPWTNTELPEGGSDGKNSDGLPWRRW
jgi:hypothetical protein